MHCIQEPGEVYYIPEGCKLPSTIVYRKGTSVVSVTELYNVVVCSVSHCTLSGNHAVTNLEPTLSIAGQLLIGDVIFEAGTIPGRLPEGTVSVLSYSRRVEQDLMA